MQQLQNGVAQFSIDNQSSATVTLPHDVAPKGFVFIGANEYGLFDIDDLYIS